jgi:hypothetical protein
MHHVYITYQIKMHKARFPPYWFISGSDTEVSSPGAPRGEPVTVRIFGQQGFPPTTTPGYDKTLPPPLCCSLSSRSDSHPTLIPLLSPHPSPVPPTHDYMESVIIGAPYTISPQALQPVVSSTGAPYCTSSLSLYFLTGATVGTMAPVEMPVVGDLVMFLSHAFQVYDEFPTGSPVGPDVAFVDWRNVFRVEDVRQALYEVPRRRRGPRRRGGAPPDVLLVAVKLSSTNGTMVWAIFSNGEHARMEICDPSLILV